MKDLFGEFMEELRRRQEAEAAMARGERPPGDGGPRDPGDRDPDEEPEPIRRPRADGPGGSGPRPPRRSAGGPNDGAGIGAVRQVSLTVVAAVAFLVFLLGGFVLDLWTDAIWFTSVGYDDVFWTRVGTQLLLFVAGLAVALLFLLGNLWVAGRLGPPPDPEGRGTLARLIDRMNEAAAAGERGWTVSGQGDDRYRARSGGPGGARDVTPGASMPDLGPVGIPLIVGLSLLLALGIGAAAAGSWETIQLYLNRVPFDAAGAAAPDPVFGRDISFFLFDLPFLRLVQSVLNGLVVGALIVAGARYLLAGLRGDLRPTTPIRVHIGVLAGLYLLSVAAGYQLDKYELVYGAQGVATGVSYTDANARFLGLDVLTAIAALAAAFLVGGAFTKMVWPLGMMVAIWLGASVVLGTLYPEFIQRFTVVPNQFAQEQPYIRNNIEMTRLAYDLDDWRQVDYGGEAPLTAASVAAEAETFRSARVWDYRPLRDVIDQVQTVRQYYEFVDVDTDRYQIDGVQRQVMLSARELAPEKNPQANSWVNQKITFTHGVGAVLVPVNEATQSGQPNLYVKDLPPVSVDGAPAIDQFRIYFGERTSDWVLVGARQSEFDYPVGSDAEGGSAGLGQQTRWTGTTGVRIDNTLTRLLFAARFRDLNLFISDQVTSESQILFHRSLGERLRLVAPFLRYDKDPYLVIREDGRLVWVQDAYSVSDRFPNAQRFDPLELPGTGLGDLPFNYIRNSVKIVVDAYDGTMSFYVADTDDPLVRAYGGVFPTLFRPLDELPEDLRSHVRYPEELFNVQTRLYATYHVTDPAAFYNREDLWTVPVDSGSDQTLPAEAYYVQMRMPGEAATEFLLLQPMVPQRRPNMIAWVAARNDGDAYGEVRVHKFPENTSVLGPNQIEARIDADPTISAQISLWSQAGSRVIRGNLIVMPIQDSLIYLQPIYLQSTSAAFPELQKVIIATSTTVVWGDTLEEALEAQLASNGTGGGSGGSGGSGSGGATPTPTPAPGGSPAPTPPTGDVAALIEYANRHFELAQAALRRGDFATYGSEIALVEEALRQLAELTGGASPAP